MQHSLNITNTIHTVSIWITGMHSSTALFYSRICSLFSYCTAHSLRLFYFVSSGKWLWLFSINFTQSRIIRHFPVFHKLSSAIVLLTEFYLDLASTATPPLLRLPARPHSYRLTALLHVYCDGARCRLISNGKYRGSGLECLTLFPLHSTLLVWTSPVQHKTFPPSLCWA